MKNKGTIPFYESLKISLLSLSTHKLRTGLTLLGMVIAVTTLIAVVAVIEGMDAYVKDRVANMGSNMFTLRRFGFITSSEEWLRQLRRNKRVTMADYQALREQCRLPQAMAGEIGGLLQDVKYGSQTMYDVGISGVTASMAGVDTIQIDYGRYIAPFDVDHARAVCVIGADVVDTLLAGLNPLGKQIKVGAIPYEIIGVAKRIGKVFGQTQDNFVKIPLSKHQKHYGTRTSINVWVRVDDPTYMQDAMDEVRLVMRTRHHLRYNDKDDFGIVTSQSFTDLWKKLTGGIAMVAVFVTSIFLVVGGIVIMNIMLSVVTERTREVGLRKSLGARRQDILVQFLIESVIMGAIGGAAGVLLAYIGTKVMSAFTPIPSALPIWAVVMALAVSSTVGAIFGIYPANKASKMDPIDALRAD